MSKNEKWDTNQKNSKELLYATKDATSIASNVGASTLNEGLTGYPKLASKIFTNVKDFFFGYELDTKVNKESKGQAFISNSANIGGSEIGSTLVGLALTGEAGIAATLIRAVGGSLFGNAVGSFVKQNYGTLKNGFGQIGKLPTINVPQMSTINQNSNQSFFNKAKLYVQKNQKADITVPTAKELLKVSNSAAVQQAINQNNAVQVIETKPSPVVQNSGSNFLSVLGNILGAVGSVASGFAGNNTPLVNQFEIQMGNQTYKSEYFPMKKHTGGKVPGRGDIIAILKGGETVRTEAQEKELQEQMLKKHFESFAPLVSGQGEDEQNQQNGAFSSYSEKKSAKPILQDRTRHDEEMIISIVADAWKTNRSGFRRILKSC